MIAQGDFGKFAGLSRIKNLKKEAEESGLKPEDVDFAIKLAFWIEVFDSLVFDHARPVLLYRWQGHQDIIAAYHPPKKYYVIFVPGLCQKMREGWQKQLVYMTKNKAVSYPLSRANKKKLISWREAMIGLASHEVRHRMQTVPGFRIFTDKNPGLESTAWDMYMKLAGKTKITKKDLLDLELSVQRDDRKGSKQKVGLTEFDARAVEGVAINLAHIGCPIAKIAKIIKMQASA